MLGHPGDCGTWWDLTGIKGHVGTSRGLKDIMGLHRDYGTSQDLPGIAGHNGTF